MYISLYNNNIIIIILNSTNQSYVYNKNFIYRL